MEDSQRMIVSFIVKIYVEQAHDDGRETTWHGKVTRVADEKSRYVHDLDGIALCIAEDIAQLGVSLNWYWRVQKWLRRRTSN